MFIQLSFGLSNVDLISRLPYLGIELPHVDVHRMKDGINLESIGKRRYPLGETLIEEKLTGGKNVNF